MAAKPGFPGAAGVTSAADVTPAFSAFSVTVTETGVQGVPRPPFRADYPRAVHSGAPHGSPRAVGGRWTIAG